MGKTSKKLIALLLCTCTLMAACSKGNDEEEPTTKKKVVVEPIVVEPVTYDLTIDDDITSLDETYDISEILYGLFLEDINYAVDGGMYAEMVKNRSFEYDTLAVLGNKHGWMTTADSVTLDVVNGASDNTALNANNGNYAIISNSGSVNEGISNAGFLDGMSVEEGKTYKISCYIKGLDGYTGSVEFSFGKNMTENNYGTATITNVTNGWWKYETTITATGTCNASTRLYIKIGTGKVALDMVSVFPAETYKDRENGIRKDIGEYLETLNGKFLRFPGGCLIEGKTLETAYDWKDSIGNGLKFTVNGKETVGDVAARVQGIDIWADMNKAVANPYYMTYGMGFYEYFLLCEDLECLPVPVVNAGMSCPIQSGTNYKELNINNDEFKQYVQDALDLVEFCKGDASTYWGSVRIAMGHSEPFELKYIGIGNEQWQDSYFAHYAKFVEAFKEAAQTNPALYGDIELIVANGPNSGDTFGWKKVEANGGLEYAALVDEHYYQTPSWFLENTTRYDSYKRGTTKVFLGEYAAKSNNLTAAIAEAAYLTGVERNADVIEMACYAPLFGNTTQTQWTPDMIWFSNNKVYGSINYYVQKMFANNVGTKLLKSDLKSSGGSSILSGMVGVGTWETAATFDDIKVVSNKTGDVLYEQDFSESSALKDGTVMAGDFTVSDGKLVQSNKGATSNTNTGDVIYFGDKNWTNYTMTFTATATGGNEGFIIPIAVTDKDNCIFWNYGGWGNTTSCLQQVTNGSKSEQIAGTVSEIGVKYNQEYELKVEVDGNNIKCYSYGACIIDYTFENTQNVYQTVSTDEETGDVIVKLVNAGSVEADVNINFANADAYNATADVTQLAGDIGSDTNSINNPENVVDKASTTQISKKFEYKLPKLSVTIIRIHKK